MTGWMLATTGATALLIGLLTISVQTILTAPANPVKSLKAEYIVPFRRGNEQLAH